MPEPKVARFYLYPALRARLLAGRLPFLSTLRDLLEARGWDVHLHDDSPEELAAARDRPGYALVRMIEPPNPRGLTFRRTYFAPFWHIERSAERWTWPVARAEFDPDTVNPQKAARFLRNMRARHFADARITREGMVLVPLQGRLQEHRSFQSMSPLAMLEAVLAHDPARRVHATLHPKERYSAAETDALDALQRRVPRLTVSLGGTAALLLACDYVATQNSSVAAAGYFLEKPAVLFGKIDFHHIAAKVHDLGAEAAIRQAPDMAPDFAAYLWWFFRDHAIDDSRPDAETRILEALRRGGWPVGG
ncbi:hypothetical protein [Sagittula stellata]|uniref:Uncharacterized protein n=1 Tax=Sagittula stellata (strain ATCC 700073 / DSM 11524 / E-37) TaxID=388399 RepID=A3K8Z5_SAGS3|nr:hypothetical protein [Sagittula stellata]EBA06378.1 hypothetical protein SSE37_18110 [Sagittula stellata E-37]